MWSTTRLRAEGRRINGLTTEEIKTSAPTVTITDTTAFKCNCCDAAILADCVCPPSCDRNGQHAQCNWKQFMDANPNWDRHNLKAINRQFNDDTKTPAPTVTPVNSPIRVVKAKKTKPKKKPYDRPEKKNYTAELQVQFQKEGAEDGDGDDDEDEECFFTVWFPDVKTFHKVELRWFHDLDDAVEKWFVATKKNGDDDWRMDSAIEIVDEETGKKPDLYYVSKGNITRTAPPKTV